MRGAPLNLRVAARGVSNASSVSSNSSSSSRLSTAFLRASFPARFGISVPRCGECAMHQFFPCPTGQFEFFPIFSLQQKQAVQALSLIFLSTICFTTAQSLTDIQRQSSFRLSQTLKGKRRNLSCMPTSIVCAQ